MRPRALNVYEFAVDGKMHIGTMGEVVQASGLPESKLWRLVNAPTQSDYGHQVGKRLPVFRLNDPDTGSVIMKGTRREIAEYLEIKEGSLYNFRGGRLIFADEYEYQDMATIKKMEDDDMRAKRTLNKVAPVPVPEKYEPTRKMKVVTTRPVEMKPFKVGEYAQYLHDAVFAKWNLKEGQ